MYRRKPNYSLFIIVVAAIVITDVIVAYFYLKGTFSDTTSPLASAKIVPNQALMAGMISTDPEAWSQLAKFGTPEARNAIAKRLKDVNKQMLAESKIDYAKDIQPWIGNIMFAVMPSEAGTFSQKTNLLLVVSIKDKISAVNFANKMKGQVKAKETDYKGIKILETGKNSQIFSAVLDNHVVFAQARKPVELAIDTFKGQPSFAGKKDARSLLGKSIGIQNPIAQIYIPEYSNTIQKLMALNPNYSPLNPQNLAQLKQVKSLVMAFGIDNSGFRMKALGELEESRVKIPYKASPGKIVAQFPKETIVLISGYGISNAWSVFVEETKNNSQLQQQLDQTRQQFKSTYNFDIDKDIFGWMDGEFALGAISSNQGVLAPIGFGGALVIKTSDRITASATLAKLDNLAKSNSATISERNVQGKTITQWTLPNQQVWIGHGWLDEESVFVAIGNPIIDMMAKNTNSLANKPSFISATNSLEKPNAGYFYLDMQQTMSLVNRYLSPAQKEAISPEANAIINSVSSIAITGIQPNSSTSQIEMLLALKPKSKK